MNGHDFTLEQNTEARMMLAVARRGLTAVSSPKRRIC